MDATQYVYTYKTVRTVTVREKPFGKEDHGRFVKDQPIYCNEISQETNPINWQGNTNLTGKKSTWAHLSSGMVVCLNDGITEYATLEYHTTPSQALPTADEIHQNADYELGRKRGYVEAIDDMIERLAVLRAEATK